jgi:hypothetical protein
MTFMEVKISYNLALFVNVQLIEKLTCWNFKNSMLVA